MSIVLLSQGKPMYLSEENNQFDVFNSDRTILCKGLAEREGEAKLVCKLIF